MKVKVKGGYKIKLESGRLLPRVYPSEAAVDERLAQLKRFRNKNKWGSVQNSTPADRAQGRKEVSSLPVLDQALLKRRQLQMKSEAVGNKIRQGLRDREL